MPKHFLYSFFCSIMLLIPSMSQAAYVSATEVVYPCTCETIEDGLYIGGGLGYDAYRIRQNISHLLSSTTFLSTSPVLNANSLVGRVFGGYGRYFDWFYIAGEFFGAHSGAQNHFSFLHYRSYIAVRSSYGASILPGIMINNFGLLYLRVGYIRTFFKYNEIGAPIGDLTGTAWSSALEYGIGLETPVWIHYNLRVEYSYAKYPTFNSELGTIFAPSNGQFMVSLLYQFG